MERRARRWGHRPASTTRNARTGVVAVGVAVGVAALAAVGLSPAAAAPSTAPESAAAPATAGTPAGVSDAKLRFDPSDYTTLTVTIDGSPVKVRWYKEVCYVANPTAVNADPSRGITNTSCGYQSMNIFVPESAWNDQKTAIYFAENNSGWLASYIRASVNDGQSFDSSTSNVGAALKNGYVFVNVATRSRGLVAADGSYAGKSPAVVVDGKAAIRYLRLNDSAMPGSAERIVVNGTSGGGGLGAVLGASGNSPDYVPYLEEVGAAGIDADGRSTLRDDVYAVNLYCPITDLGNADAIYEWLFNVLDTRASDSRLNAHPQASAEIAAQFPAYEASLKLTNPDGTPLNADTVLSQLQREVTRSAEIFMRRGGVIPDLGETFTYPAGAGREVVFSNDHSVNDWLDVDNAAHKVVGFNMANYLHFLATQASLKPAPAFDRYGVLDDTDNGTESTLFGTSDMLYQNFAPWSWANNNVAGDGSGTDDTGLSLARYLRRPSTTLDDQLKLINPMAYIDTNADAAPYWYIRVGTRDRDTAPLVSLNLDRKLLQDRSIKDVDYHLAWMQPHAGNYDVPEAMAWIGRSLAAGDRTDTPPAAQPTKPGRLHHPKVKKVGKAHVGRRVKVKLGDISAWPAGAKVAYAWTVGGRAVENADDKALRLTRAMRHKKVVVTVTVTARGYETLHLRRSFGRVN